MTESEMKKIKIRTILDDILEKFPNFKVENGFLNTGILSLNIDKSVYDLYNFGCNVDWKALSHAVRSLTQMKQLISRGMIIFPLYNSDYLIDIKQGRLSFKEVERIIYDGIKEIDGLLQNAYIENKKDVDLIERIILGAYE